MKLARIASFVHKWLALLVGVQIVFWVGSGLFFTLFPIEQIRSEHLIRETAPQTIDTALLPAMGALRGPNGELPTKLIVEQRPGGQVVLAEFADAPPALYDARTMRRLSPLGANEASAIARAHVSLATAPSSITRITEASPEYKGALPAYRVHFNEGGLSVYVAENTGAVTARRSDLWRVYDTLWALHIMDWRNHEDFNHPLIVAAAWLTLLSVLAGVVLIPYRIGFGRRARTSAPAAGAPAAPKPPAG
ncbi:MAG TPA: PepSY domain-containing protein [Vitreimonas sp.]|uniref:PepSY domain-containing protein n=1 Tax=Vitreimonas sp. TaxID=3069702 RepID=UPI002D287DA4|nr:PepSY domain-containing protein [Vitreimonas sp.]HYD86885.1 PepSY domain-containing protein [Vitreimonas sp.]